MLDDVHFQSVSILPCQMRPYGRILGSTCYWQRFTIVYDNSLVRVIIKLSHFHLNLIKITTHFRLHTFCIKHGQPNSHKACWSFHITVKWNDTGGWCVVCEFCFKCWMLYDGKRTTTSAYPSARIKWHYIWSQCAHSTNKSHTKNMYNKISSATCLGIFNIFFALSSKDNQARFNIRTFLAGLLVVISLILQLAMSCGVKHSSTCSFFFE